MRELEQIIIGYSEEKKTLTTILHSLDYYYSNQSDKQIKDIKDRILAIDAKLEALLEKLLTPPVAH
jgi:hypothetical protein